MGLLEVPGKGLEAGLTADHATYLVVLKGFLEWNGRTRRDFTGFGNCTLCFKTFQCGKNFVDFLNQVITGHFSACGVRRYNICCEFYECCCHMSSLEIYHVR